MEMYKKYTKEKYGREVYHNEHGFIEYELFNDNSMYIYTLYVTKEARNNGQGKVLETELIKKYNPSVIFCDICKDSNEWVLSLVQICKKADYNVYEDRKDKVVLFKELVK